jgi:hypothetical protein
VEVHPGTAFRPTQDFVKARQLLRRVPEHRPLQETPTGAKPSHSAPPELRRLPASPAGPIVLQVSPAGPLVYCLYPEGRRPASPKGSAARDATLPEPARVTTTTAVKVSLLQELLDRAKRLPRSLIVFNQSKSNETFSQRSEADTRRHSHQSFFE